MVRSGPRKCVGLEEIEDLLAAPHSGEPAQQERLEKCLVLFRCRCVDREKDHRSRVGAMVQEVVGDAARVKAARSNEAIRAERMAHFSEQESQEVGNLRRGPDR